MKWVKRGMIFSPQNIDDGTERPWMKAFSQCTSALIMDHCLRVYFSCRPDNDHDGQAVSYTSYVDLDKDDFSKILHVAKEPVLPLGLLGTFDEFAVYPSSVIRYKNEVRLYYAGWTRCKSVPFNTSIGVAISKDDGKSFERIGNGPIVSASLDEPFVISGPKVRIFNDKWYLFYLAGTNWIIHNGKPEIVYKIRMATSTDGISWNKLNKNIISNALEETECQAGPDVFYFDGIFHMYFVYRYALDFRDDRNRGYRIGYARSIDLEVWHRDDENAGIALSESGNWDGDMMHYPHIFKLNEKYHMLYNGNAFGRYGFGYATMQLNGSAGI